MAKYSVTINYQRTQIVLVDAINKQDAIELVYGGEFDDDRITHTEDENVEILRAVCVDAETLVSK
jgi:hypothetical protein